MRSFFLAVVRRFSVAQHIPISRNARTNCTRRRNIMRTPPLQVEQGAAQAANIGCENNGRQSGNDRIEGRLQINA